jgi:hypothetical protein
MRNTLKILIYTAIALSSCTGKKLGKTTAIIDIMLVKPIANKADESLPLQIKQLLRPLESVADTIRDAYKVELLLTRKDVLIKSQLLDVPKSGMNLARSLIKFYTYGNLMSDYANEVPKIKAGSILSQRSINTVDIIDFINDSTLVIVPDSTKYSGKGQAFQSIAGVRNYIFENIRKNESNNRFTVVFGEEERPSPDSFQRLKEGIYTVLSSKNYANAPIIAQELVIQYGKDPILFKELLQKADSQFVIAKQLAVNSQDCGFITIPLSYYACAAALATDKHKNLIRQKEKNCFDFAKSKGCTFAKVIRPSSLL